MKTCPDVSLSVFRLLVVVCFAMVAGCATGPTRINTPSLSLSWAVPEQNVSDGSEKSDLTVAIVRPSFITEKLGSYQNETYFRMFEQALESDIQSILIAKGMKVKGPYDDFDMMTYPDKKRSNLALIPKVILNISENYHQNERRPLSIGGGEFIKIKGTLSVDGFIEFSLVEPISQQKVWIKRINMPEVQETIDVNLMTTDNQGNLNQFNRNRDNRHEALVNMLNTSYPMILDNFWKYLNPEEINHLSQEAESARKAKVY